MTVPGTGSPHCLRPGKTGFSVFPKGVSSYSTRGGTSANTVRFTRPSCSSSRSWSVALGALRIALLAATNQVHASRTEVSRGLGHISMHFGVGTSFQTIRDHLIYAAVTLAIAVLPYLVWRMKRARSVFA